MILLLACSSGFKRRLAMSSRTTKSAAPLIAPLKLAYLRDNRRDQDGDGRPRSLRWLRLRWLRQRRRWRRRCGGGGGGGSGGGRIRTTSLCTCTCIHMDMHNTRTKRENDCGPDEDLVSQMRARRGKRGCSWKVQVVGRCMGAWGAGLCLFPWRITHLKATKSLKPAHLRP